MISIDTANGTTAIGASEMRKYLMRNNAQFTEENMRFLVKYPSSFISELKDALAVLSFPFIDSSR